jgi:hypothetical protein
MRIIKIMLAVIGAGLLVFVAIGILAVMSGSSHGDATASTQSGVGATQPSCTAADFSVSKVRENTEYEYAKLTGIVTCHCIAAAGVQLKWTAFNADGTVAFSDDFWPAGTTITPPNTRYAFETMNMAPRGNWTYRVESIGVNTW